MSLKTLEITLTLIIAYFDIIQSRGYSTYFRCPDSGPVGPGRQVATARHFPSVGVFFSALK